MGRGGRGGQQGLKPYRAVVHAILVQSSVVGAGVIKCVSFFSVASRIVLGGKVQVLF